MAEAEGVSAGFSQSMVALFAALLDSQASAPFYAHFNLNRYKFLYFFTFSHFHFSTLFVGKEIARKKFDDIFSRADKRNRVNSGI